MNRDDIRVLLWAGVAAAVIMVTAVTAAGAEPACPKNLKCWQVRAAVATFGEPAAESHVRACGWSDAKIAEARKCLR